MAKREVAALVAKWRDDANAVEAMGYSQQAGRLRDCANELAEALSQQESAERRKGA